MTTPVSTICIECGSLVDATLLGGTCPRCLLGDVMTGGEEKRGEDFDGHELMGEIARGGMGVVYRARQFEPDRVVALKTLRAASLDSPEAMGRFKHEAEIMVSLDHSSILPVYQCGEMDGIPFFTMKLVEGGTLAEHIGEYSGKWREIAELMATVCDGVRHAHERGVLHRDLKPGNILFDSAGQAYVSDFGIAKLADSQNAGLTMTMSVIGTPHYLAPEIAAGSVKAASVASDVWSLGVILYELLTGERPFKGESVTMVLRALDTADATAPKTLRADVPRDLEVITLKALSRDPARRYASAQAVADDLRAWLEDRPITARAVPAHERARLWARRNPRLAGTAALLVLSLIGAAASLVWGFIRVKQENARVIVSEAQTRAQLRESLLHQARAGRVAREMGWRATGLAALREANAIRPGDDLRDEAVAHLAGFDLRRVEGGPTTTFISSPEMDRYAGVGADGTVEIRSMTDHTVLRRTPIRAGVNQLNGTLDQRGEWLALRFPGAGTDFFSLPDTATVRREAMRSRIAVSDDGARLGFRDYSHLLVMRTKDWSDEARIKVDLRMGFEHVLDPNPGRTLMCGISVDAVNIIDWRQERVLETYKPFSRALIVEWRGDVVCLALESGQIQLIDLRRRQTTLLSGHASPATEMHLARDGTLFLSSSADGITHLWQPSSGVILTRARGMIVSQMSADATRFASEVFNPGLGVIERPACVRFLPDHLIARGASQQFRGMDVSPDGRWIVLRDASQVAIQELGSGRLILREDAPMCCCAFFTADGGSLVLGAGQVATVRGIARDGTRLVLAPARTLAPPEGAASMTFAALNRGRLLLLAGSEPHVARVPDLTQWRADPLLGGMQMAGLSASPDALWLAGFNRQGAVVARKDGDPAAEKIFTGLRNGITSFSPDGRWLAVVTPDRALTVLDTRDWSEAARLPPPPDSAPTQMLADLRRAAWAPGGGWLTHVFNGTDIEIIETGTWRALARLRGPVGLPVMGVAAAPDGMSLIVLRASGPVEVWELARLREELAALGITLDLPPPAIPPPALEELRGPFDEREMPPLKFGGTVQGR